MILSVFHIVNKFNEKTKTNKKIQVLCVSQSDIFSSSVP